jgi:hypothetical protein
MGRSNDIEDVLASIRRLVSEDVPRTPTRPEPRGALVLDATRRVADPEDPFRAIETVSEATAPRSTPMSLSAADFANSAATAEAAAGPEASAPMGELEAPVTALALPRPDRPKAGRDAEDQVDLADLDPGPEGEEALRRMIEEVVRQELSGALGERITRNVRKLVRREIRRVLSDDEFD